MLNPHAWEKGFVNAPDTATRPSLDALKPSDGITWLYAVSGLAFLDPGIFEHRLVPDTLIKGSADRSAKLGAVAENPTAHIIHNHAIYTELHKEFSDFRELLFTIVEQLSEYCPNHISEAVAWLWEQLAVPADKDIELISDWELAADWEDQRITELSILLSECRQKMHALGMAVPATSEGTTNSRVTAESSKKMFVKVCYYHLRGNRDTSWQ